MSENKFQEASEKFQAAKIFFEKQNSTSAIAQCFLYLGKIASAAGHAVNAVALFEEGQSIASMAGDKSLLTVFLSGIAEEKLKSGAPTEAIALLQEARKVAVKTQEKPMLGVISQQLSKGYEATGNLKEALQEYKNFIVLKEEINSVETTTRLRNLQISTKVEVLEKENKLLEAERIAAVHELTAQLNMQEIKSLNAMMEGQEKERRRIAADLHDRIGSALSAIKLHLTGFANSLDNVSQKKMEFGKVVSMFDEAVKEVRQVSHDLASGVLVKFGLVPALRDLSESIQSASNLSVKFFTGGFDDRLDHRTEISLYRITQELISNILKHAHAKEINIYLHRQDDHLSLMVEDDGIGFDPAKASDGIGMKNIRWRVSQLKGNVLYDSLPGKGCTITIEIPTPKL
ncbi:MAG: sensor histidine kinase, partial [Chitinophagales bacterium]